MCIPKTELLFNGCHHHDGDAPFASTLLIKWETEIGPHRILPEPVVFFTAGLMRDILSDLTPYRACDARIGLQIEIPGWMVY